jgi:hypothetical protein
MKKKQFPILELAVLLFLLQGLQTIGQETPVFEKFSNHSYHSDWVTHHETDQIRILVKYSDCSDLQNGIYPEYLLFKVENLTNKEVYAYWTWSFAYNGKTTSVEGSDENLVQVRLQPGLSSEGSCVYDEFHKLKIYVQDKNDPSMSQLTSFSINDLNVFEL